MYFLIGADIVPTESNARLFENGDAQTLVGDELKQLLVNSSFNIANLEVPLTNEQCPITKSGPNLIAASETVNGYKALNINLLTLANNHIMDQGDSGLMSTMKALDENGIDTVGIFIGLKSGDKGYFFPFAGKKIGIYACAEHEFTIAEDANNGANPLDSLDTYDNISKIKENCDWLVVLLHGGEECYRYPTPQDQKTARKMAKKGADLIVFQHTHCIGSMEQYGAAKIVYGQGNFIFDHGNNEYWNSGLLIKVDENLRVSYVPFEKRAGGIISLSHDDSILQGFYDRSEKIKKDNYIEQSYSEYVSHNINCYMEYIRRIRVRESLFFRICNKLSGQKFRKAIKDAEQDISKSDLLFLLNTYTCEAHRELMITGIKQLLENKRS